MAPKKVLLAAATDADWQQVFNIRYGKGKFVKIKTWQDFKKFLLLSYAQENAVMNRLRSLYPNSSLSFTDPDRDYLIIGPSGTCNRYDIERIDEKGNLTRIEVKNCKMCQKNNPYIVFNEHWKLPWSYTPLDISKVEKNYWEGRLHSADLIYFVDEACSEFCICNIQNGQYHASVGPYGNVVFLFDHYSWHTL